MRVLYIADDGTEFDDQWDCEDYEWIQNHQRLKEIVFLDEDGKTLENPMSENTYINAETIVVPTDEAAKELRELGEYCGWFYDSIISAGTWVFNEAPYNTYNTQYLLKS